jgi:hypothetical protein
MTREMPTDYDAPRVVDAAADESLDALTARRDDAAMAVLDEDDDAVESFELADADLTGVELTTRVLPKQADEFTCSSCFLVHHRSRLARHERGQQICADCI